MAEHAQSKSGDHIDAKDQQCSNRIAFDEFARAIHRTVEIRLDRHFAAAFARFVRVDHACGNVGIDCHLLAGQGIEHKAGGDFRDAACAFGNHDHIDDQKDRENEQANGEIPADQKCAKTVNYSARCRAALVPVDQYDAGRSDIQRQPEQSCEEQNGGEGGKVQWLARIQGHHQNRHRHCDVEDQQYVEQQRGDGQHHQHEQHQNAHGNSKRDRRFRPIEDHRPSAFILS